MTIKSIPAGNREEWLRLRGQDVTASVAGALLGAHEFITPFELWAFKSGRLEMDPEETPAMRRGRLLEPVAVQMLKEDRPNWMVEHNTGKRQVYLRDPEIRLGATPDVLVKVKRSMRRGVVQIKSVEQSVFRKKWLGEDGEPRVPLWIACQAIVEAKLTGADFAYAAALVVGHGVELHLIEVPIHEGVFDRICEETVAFWARVESGEEPEPDYASDGETIARLYYRDDGTEIDLSGDERFRSLVELRAETKARIAADLKALEPVEAEIIHRIGNHERAYLTGWRVSRPMITRRDKTFGTLSRSRQLRISPQKDMY